MKLRPRVRTLFASSLLLVVIVPVLTIFLLRIYESYLVRQTEDVLIAEAVVVGEMYRAFRHPGEASQPLHFPADPEEERYYPFEARIDLRRDPILPRAQRAPSFGATASVSPRLTEILERSMVRNLSGIRVLDERGRVVASPLREVGYSLGHLPEVAAALKGRYQPALRERKSETPTPPLRSLSRASKIRLSIAIPVYRDPQVPAGSGAEVIGAIYNSRTPLDVERSLWLLRRDLYWPVLSSAGVVLFTVMLLGYVIGKPLSKLRRAAERVAAGDHEAKLALDGFAPQEVLALSAALARMRDQLQARAEYVEEFATNAVHELKTPLTSLRGAAELILDGGESMAPEQRRRFLENIHKDAVRMDQLVQRILQLARIESSSPLRKEIDLQSFLKAVAERYARNGRQVRIQFDARDKVVRMDPDQLESLLSNLIDNAARHGGAEPIDVSVADSAEGRILIVRDYGPPLPKEHFDRIFERFYTTERSRGGTGLGLSIVRAIAEAHGGKVRAERAERGAIFTVALETSAGRR